MEVFQRRKMVMRWSNILTISILTLIFAFSSNEANAKYDRAYLHGMGHSGNNSAVGANNKGAYEYWGGTHNERRCTRRSWGVCKSYSRESFSAASYAGGTRLFANSDSKNRGWNNANLQREFVAIANRANKSFAHSMGNPTLAAACHNGKGCVKWNNTQGPLVGSSGANFVDTACNSWWYKWNIGVVASLFGFCTPAAYTLRTDRATFRNAAYQNTAARQISKSFCGNDTNMWRSGSAAGLSFVRNVVMGGNGDGLVDTWSCSIHGKGKNISWKGCDHEQGTGRADNCGSIRSWLR